MFFKKFKTLFHNLIAPQPFLEIKESTASPTVESYYSILTAFPEDVRLDIKQQNIENHVVKILNNFNYQIIQDSKQGNFITHFTHEDPTEQDLIALQIIQKQLKKEGFKANLGKLKQCGAGVNYSWLEITLQVSVDNLNYSTAFNENYSYLQQQHIGISALSPSDMLDNHYQHVRKNKLHLLNDIHAQLDCDHKKGNNRSLFTKEAPTQADLVALELISVELKKEGFKINLGKIQYFNNGGSFAWNEISMAILHSNTKKHKSKI